MSFNSKCKKQGIDKNNIPPNYEYFESFNSNNAVDDNTKVIIVGTLTPYKGRNNGYFYSAKGNPVYEILDNYFICNIFVELKNQLISRPKDTVKINKIKQELRNHNIAFLDVIKEAISPIDTSADNAIKELILDYDAFKNIKNDVVFICNSRAAEYALNIIKDKNNLSNTTEYVPQYSRRISKDEKQRQWNEKLKKVNE